jgi:hypothetical protein
MTSRRAQCVRGLRTAIGASLKTRWSVGDSTSTAREPWSIVFERKSRRISITPCRAARAARPPCASPRSPGTPTAGPVRRPVARRGVPRNWSGPGRRRTAVSGRLTADGVRVRVRVGGGGSHRALPARPVGEVELLQAAAPVTAEPMSVYVRTKNSFLFHRIEVHWSPSRARRPERQKGVIHPRGPRQWTGEQSPAPARWGEYSTVEDRGPGNFPPGLAMGRSGSA